MPKYNQLVISAQRAPKSALTHSRQPLGITTSTRSTQGQLQNGIQSQEKQHCPIHWQLLKMQMQTFIITSLLCALYFLERSKMLIIERQTDMVNK